MTFTQFIQERHPALDKTYLDAFERNLYDQLKEAWETAQLAMGLLPEFPSEHEQVFDRR